MTGLFSRARRARVLGGMVAAVGLTVALVAPAAAATSTDRERNGGTALARTAGPATLRLNGGWQEFSFGQVGSGAVMRLSAPAETWLRVTDAFCAGDEFEVMDNGVPLGPTSPSSGSSSCDMFTQSLTRAEVGDAWSSGGWVLPAGQHTLTIVPSRSPFTGGVGFARADFPAVVTARLRGSEEAPAPGDPDGMGVSTMLLSPGSGHVCYVTAVRRIDDVLAGHIHRGDPGMAGPIVVNLLLPPGPQRVFANCVPADRDVLRAIVFAPWKYYTNVHTTAFPAGAIRGQLQPPRSP